MEIVDAHDAHAAGINEIYNANVLESSATFDLEPWTLGKRLQWLTQYSSSGRYRALVALDGEVVTGYATSSVFRPRPAYDPTVEASVYVRSSYAGQRIATALYKELFSRLTDERVHRVIAGITLPNPPSVGFHESMGFTQVGRFTEAGFKFDQWWDVGWFELDFEKFRR